MNCNKHEEAKLYPLPKLLIGLAICARSLSLAVPDMADAAPAPPVEESGQQIPKRLVVLDFKLTGDVGGSRFDSLHRHLTAIASAKMREELKRHRLYDIVDDAAARRSIAEAAATQNLHRCNGCELDLAKRLNAELVMVPWVFRMSNLVLTLHAEIRDTVSGRIVMKTALDFRGDNDAGWLHAIDYLINQMRRRKA